MRQNWQEKEGFESMSDSTVTNEPERLFKLREVAGILGFTDWQIRQMVRLGHLPATRVGFGRGVWQVKKSDLNAYIAERATKNKKLSRGVPTPD